MLDIFKERLHQKYRTLDFPHKAPGLSPRYMGRPEIAAGDCGSCRACLDVCHDRNYGNAPFVRIDEKRIVDNATIEKVIDILREEYFAGGAE